MKLTGLQTEVLERLKKEGEMNWKYTTAWETRTLNQLVKKGVVTFDRRTTIWKPASV